MKEIASVWKIMTATSILQLRLVTCLARRRIERRRRLAPVPDLVVELEASLPQL